MARANLDSNRRPSSDYDGDKAGGNPLVAGSSRILPPPVMPIACCQNPCRYD
jgi:hypothetical protein